MTTTKIEWTDTTWNPVAGCSLVSPGCTNCYAMKMAKRLEAMRIDKYRGLTYTSGTSTVWNGTIREDKSSLSLPYKWRKPRKVFVNSMSDLFHDGVSEEFILSVWSVMRDNPQHQFQILTKRPERMLKVIADSIQDILPNAWLGTSVENASCVGRLEYLRNTPASVRFVSFEPLIGPVGKLDLSDIHWAIVGGESGYGARPIKEAWIDQIYKQCTYFETAFFFKQWGAWGKDNQKRSKKANGRHYRGKLWDEMPITL